MITDRIGRHHVLLPINHNYGVPLRSKYPDSEMLFQKQKISRDVQNTMPKIITYRSIPKKKCTSSSSLFDEIIDHEIFDGKINSKSKIFDDVTYGVPLRSKYPDSEILFQKQKISRDVQNMMPKIITYRSRPKKR